MFTKKLFKLSALFVVLTIVLSVGAFATTYYVNGITGLDGQNGLSPTVTGTPGVGPKLTISNAIAAASSTDTISVDYANGNLYNEAVVLGNGATTTPGSKKMTFTSTNGTPSVLSFTLNNGLASPNNTVTFTSGFKFTSGLTLQAGALIGAQYVTVGGSVTRYAISATVSSTVDAQLLYTGTVNFTYQTGGFVMTTALEMPPAANTSTIGSLTTVGAGVVTLNESKTMSGALTTAAGLNLGGGTLTIAGANTGHSIGGDVTNGTVAFTLTGTATIAGSFNLPAVTAAKTSGTAVLNLNTTHSIGNISVSGATAVTVLNAGVGATYSIGDVNNSGTGTVP